MIAFTQQVAIQNAEFGVRANVILPGLMDTPMAVDTRARVSGKSRAEVAAGRDARCRCATRWAPPGTSPTPRCFLPPTRRISLPALRCRSTAARWSISIEFSSAPAIAGRMKECASSLHSRCSLRALSLCSVPHACVVGITCSGEINGRQLKPREVKIRVHDGVEIAVALYMPQGEGPFPVVLAPSPYRYDNNALPATPQFLWRETGRSNCMSGAATSTPIWTSAAAASRAVNSACSIATSRRTSTTSSNGSAINRGRTARSAASGSLILHVAMVDGDPETAVARLHRRL